VIAITLGRDIGIEGSKKKKPGGVTHPGFEDGNP
jgi:hypothetical protein